MDLDQRIIQLIESGISRPSAAKELGMSKYQLQIMLDTMGVKWPKVNRPGSYVIDGVRDTLAGHAVRYDTTVNVIRYRVKNNQDMGPPKMNPVSENEVLEFVSLRKDNVPAWEAAELVGRPYNTLKNAAKKLFPEYEQIVANSTRVRRSANEIYGDAMSKAG